MVDCGTERTGFGAVTSAMGALTGYAFGIVLRKGK